MVEENVHPTKEGMAFEAIRPLKNKGIIIDCPDDKAAQRLLQTIQINEKLSEEIRCKKSQIRFPRCIVYDIPKVMEGIEMLETLELAAGAPKGSLKSCFRIKGKQEYSHLVFSTKPEFHIRLINQQKVLINWKKHSIREHFSVRRCFRCQGFLHTQMA
ncbi:hypothetical protein AVEN_88089-1 [Araneus ventricosus]|uniref:Uncharacterized protein n=1 Tax=Araneus ventricosus TaxID=182803 RepID=A0A4Y2NF13_ARAVE|nr:hypothetical protein AVEN_88089-1 [Araneus ventricosus]